MRGIPRWLAVALLTLTILGALSGAVGAAADDGLTNTTNLTSTPTPINTTDSTTDTVDNTTDSTTDTVDNTTDSTTDTVDSTTDSTTDAVDSTTDSTTDTVDSTTDAVDSTTDSTTDALDTTTSTDDTTSILDDATLLDDDSSTFAVSADSTAAGDGSLEPDEDGGSVSTGTFATEEPTELASLSVAGGSRQFPTGPGSMAAGAAAVAGFGAVAAGSMLGGGTGVERQVARSVTDSLGRLVRMVAPFRYSRYDGSDPLEHEDRAAIHEYVTEQPGAYMSAVSEEVGIPHSTARHHIRVLEREGLVENAKVRGRRRLFPAHAQQQELAAAMTDEATADVLEAIARLGPCSGSALAEEVGKSVSTVSHHLSRLEDDGLVVRQKDGRTTVNSLPGEVQDALSPDREPAAEPTAVSAD